MIQRILLIDVDVMESRNTSHSVFYSHHPVGLLYLVSAVKKSFPEIDFKVLHTSVCHDPLEKAETIITSFKPDLIGLRALSLARESFEIMARMIRKLRPDVPLVAGGPYPSSSYAEIIKAGWADIVVIGEGEDTFVDLVGRLMKSSGIPQDIQGTVVIENGMVKVNDPRPLIPVVDVLPFPDYNYIDLQDYCGIQNHALQDASKSAFIFSSRGCPYACFYCHQMFGKKIRRRSAENVVAEMREHLEKRDIRDFVFLDDVFNVPMTDAKKLLSVIIKELPGIRINFPNGLRADMIDDELIELFEHAGTVEMALAVETVTPRLQKLTGKNLDIDKARHAIEALSKRFITRVFFITGFPSETYDEALETIDFAASLEYAAQPMLSVLRIYNNTRLYHLLDPNPAQALELAVQEQKELHLKMFDDIEFYGDLFPAEKVPLKSNDLKELLVCWMRNVLINPKRIQKSHTVLKKHLDHERILAFYGNVFNKTVFKDSDLKKLLEL
ncbi:MAG TPA: radical SAM protein [Bacteroidales bacterium]|nr:radical SAM protein [Bacteroidales bacterium]